MTINQALEKIFVSYQNKNIEEHIDIQLLKFHLVELKMVWGGDAKVEDLKTVENTIKYGTADKSKWIK